MYWDTSNGALQFQDSVKIYMGPTSTSVASTQPGPGAGLQLEGNSTYGLILGTNNITIRGGQYGGNKTVDIEGATSNTGIRVSGGAGVQIYYNNNEKIVTTNTGAIVSGVLTATTFSGPVVTDDLTIGSTVGIATSGGVFTAVPGAPEDLNVFAVATEDYKSIEYTVHFTNGNNIQSQKILVMQNGSNAYYTEYAIMSNPNKIASLGAIVSGSNCKLQATPESGISGVTTFRLVRQTIL